MPLIQRYITGELLRVFAFSVSVLTILLVFVGVFAQAQERGLGPAQALSILPYVVPSMLPFTLPATLLLTVCVVYGRMSGDLEITATKAAGISTMTLLWPALALGGTMSVVSFYAMDQVTPWAMANIERTVAEAMEDIFLDVLRTRHQFTDQQHGVSITVLDVEDRTLIMPTFQYAPPGKQPVTIQAERATLKFNVEKREVDVHLVRGYVDMPGHDQAWFEEEERAFPLPDEQQETKPRWLSITSIRSALKSKKQEQIESQARYDTDMAFALTLGEYHRFREPAFLKYRETNAWEQKLVNKMHTEIWNRLAMAISCFGFVLVGAPTAIWQGKKQFFSVFFACFLPILLGYYPIVLLMMNLSKTGDADPAIVMWVGNVLLFIAGGLLLRKVLRY